MLDVLSSENQEKTLRFVLTFYRQATDRLPTHYQQSADFLGSSSSQLPKYQPVYLFNYLITTQISLTNNYHLTSEACNLEVGYMLLVTLNK